jgi:putative ABC transport system substrate-binding protein
VRGLLTRFRSGIALAHLSASLAGCASVNGRATAPTETAAPIVDPAPRAGAAKIFIAMPNSANFVEVRKSLVSELRRTFDIETFVVTPHTTDGALGAAIERANPACVVLMNNTTIGLASRYAALHPESTPRPTVLLMASLVDEAGASLKRATGISYEVPGVIAFVNLRSVVRTPVRRVGVVVRPSLRKFVERQKGPAATEKIDIVAIPVPNDVTAEGLRDALDTLIKDRHVDALWMLNDNALVRDAQYRDDAWRAELHEREVPLIVGAANLVNPASPLGTMAVVPDHDALGLQAANLIFEMADDGWRVDAHPVELPLSVKTIVDVKAAREHFGLRDDALKHIDRAEE